MSSALELRQGLGQHQTRQGAVYNTLPSFELCDIFGQFAREEYFPLLTAPEIEPSSGVSTPIYLACELGETHFAYTLQEGTTS